MDSAYIYAKRVLEIDPKSANGYQAFGEYYNNKREIDSAIENYKLAIIHYKPGDYIDVCWSEAQLGNIYCYHRNDYVKGLTYLQRGIDHATEEQLYSIELYLFFAFFNIGDYDRATKYIQKVLKSEDGVCFGIRNYSFMHMIQGEYNQVINFLDSICNITLCEDYCNYNLYLNHFFLGQYDEAEKHFENYVDEGGTPWIWDSLLLTYKYKELGKEQDAKKILNSIRNSFENQLPKDKNRWTYINLSITHALLNEKEEALKYLSNAVELGLKTGWHDFLPICPFYKNYWDDPEFKAIVKRAQDEKAAIRAQVQEMIDKGEIDL